MKIKEYSNVASPSIAISVKSAQIIDGDNLTVYPYVTDSPVEIHGYWGKLEGVQDELKQELTKVLIHYINGRHGTKDESRAS